MSEEFPCSWRYTNENPSDKKQAMLKYTQNHVIMTATTNSIFLFVCFLFLFFLIPCSLLGNRWEKHLNGSCSFTSHVFNVIFSKSTTCCVPPASDYFRELALEKRKTKRKMSLKNFHFFSSYYYHNILPPFFFFFPHKHDCFQYFKCSHIF